jgi:hypothetical protein
LSADSSADPAALGAAGHVVASCDLCATVAPTDPPPLTWVSGVERGQRVWHCAGCALQHLRSIEAGLDSAWW